MVQQQDATRQPRRPSDRLSEQQRADLAGWGITEEQFDAWVLEALALADAEEMQA